MTYAPKSAPKSEPKSEPRSTRMTGTAIQGEHGLWYIPGTSYQYTKRSDGVFCIYAPGCDEDGLEFAKAIS